MRRTVLFLFAALLAFFSGRQTVFAENSGHLVIQDPCGGSSALLAIIDRPTVSDSACAVPFGQAVLELGYQHVDMRGLGGGTADNYPEAELRVGLPGSNEFVILPPNYNRQRTPGGPASGLSAITLGMKHEIGYTSHVLGAVEALFTVPSGNASFGSKGPGIAINGIVNYSLTDQFSLALQLGVSSQTTPELAGGERFTFLISNLVATWQITPQFQVLGEIFGQSSAGPGDGAGFDANVGGQYLITHWWAVDMEEGVRLIGNLGGFTHYFGIGSGFLF